VHRVHYGLWQLCAIQIYVLLMYFPVISTEVRTLIMILTCCYQDSSFVYSAWLSLYCEMFTDVTIIEIEIVFLTENRIESKSYFSCIPSNDLSIEALD